MNYIDHLVKHLRHKLSGRTINAVLWLALRRAVQLLNEL